MMIGGSMVRSIMNFAAKRQLVVQVAARYREAGHSQKSVILDEVVAATGYARKYAIRLLTNPDLPPPATIIRPRARLYGPEVQEALVVAWRAANGICSKRLIPFLPELIPVLERHGHLVATDAVRAQLLALSPATADRLLRPFRQRDGIRGTSTTKPGALLKRQIPIRTFADWDEARPGFLEADLVAHCGHSTEGAFLHTLTLTDVATCWVECLPLLHRTQHAVKQALDHAGQLLPFPILGLDTDNGGEFINDLLLAYCEQQHITFTRGRVAKKNDQCFVEQKNGSVVRQVVGYDRFEGEPAYRQLAELYRALRLYVNFFQPSMKLQEKIRDGSRVRRTYDQAATPWQRLVTAGVLDAGRRERLETIYQALDPVVLLRQIDVLQDALWRRAVLRTAATEPEDVVQAPIDAVAFDLTARGPWSGEASGTDDSSDGIGRSRRKYHRTVKTTQPRWWRTRPDPFADVWEEVEGWLRAAPERTAKAMFQELQDRHPGQFTDSQVRTLQRRVKEWRERSLVQFDAAWLDQDALAGAVLPPRLKASVNPDETSTSPQPAAALTA
jgi:hypothetical protein